MKDGRPGIVCLCGSTRFREIYEQENRRLTLEGYMVLSVGLFAGSGDEISPDQKKMLDGLHLRKIELSDEVRVLNYAGYIGESTSQEIRYARDLGIPITFYEETDAEEIA